MVLPSLLGKRQVLDGEEVTRLIHPIVLLQRELQSSALAISQ